MFAFAGQPCRRLDAAGKHNDQGWNSWQSSALSCWATARRTVITADPTWAIDGQPVARVGDQVTCPRCKRTTTIATSRFSNTIDSGRPVAFDQDTTDCGAVLYSRHNGHAGHDDGSSDTAAARATSSDAEVYTPREAPRFDEHFILRDSGTGKPLVGWQYTVITAEGQQIEGETDAQGRTEVVWTDSPAPVQVKAQPSRKNDDPYHYGTNAYEGL